MESSKLADRLRGIIAPKSGQVGVGGRAENPSPRRSIGAGAEYAGPRATADTGPQNLERLLGGEWRDLGGSRSFVVERVLDANTACGNIEVGDLARCHERAAEQAPMLSAGEPDLMCSAATSSCPPAALELQVLGARRSGEVAGFEIPVRFFQFVRSGDARPIAAVLEHNRLDLLSVAALSAPLLHLLEEGPAEAKDAREAFALGRTYARAGMASRAIDAYQMAITMRSARSIRLEILMSLAQTYRRWRRLDEAAGSRRPVLQGPR